ncbi:hypothetical protein ERX46_08530 [Brumimicrobium glaciale]|uniref:Lipocalin-like domain-containing protein n=1 Tax=Brumimicrobium glaciale TaxID=200475 RepID=A0A4Q4KL61_9FLAO|nr:hypothetical protein [Brumimicrobium glaciale]RYM34002.1 hypothetical protein ERX46_08530 [Brumimicrobium glaciale]
MKTLAITVIIILCSFSSKAQEAKIIGSWLVTKVETADETQNPFVIKEYNKDGKMLMMGMEIGTWNYNKKSNEIEMKSDIDKDFNGNDKILILTDKELIVEKEGVKVTYLKLDFKKIVEQNKVSKLAGSWKLENEFDETQLLKIELPDVFTLTEVSPISDALTTTKGTWVYNSEEKSVLFIGKSRLLKGKSTIKELSENGFILVKNGEEIIGQKETSTMDIEKLSFSFEDFTEESNENSPWTNLDALLNELENTTYLKYKQSELIPNTSSFRYTTLLSKIDINLEERSISLVNLSISQNDTVQFSESYKDEMYNMYNDFFPQEEPDPYRMATTESITVPAGEFNCKVFEGFDGEAKVKYWMILDKPGIYAKIIREEIGHFDELEYSIIELVEIK